MLMQNSGVANKEHYGMLRYFWSGQYHAGHVLVRATGGDRAWAYMHSGLLLTCALTNSKYAEVVEFLEISTAA